jgi:hypothetical protein
VPPPIRESGPTTRFSRRVKPPANSAPDWVEQSSRGPDGVDDEVGVDVDTGRVSATGFDLSPQAANTRQESTIAKLFTCRATLGTLDRFRREGPPSAWWAASGGGSRASGRGGAGEPRRGRVAAARDGCSLRGSPSGDGEGGRRRDWEGVGVALVAHDRRQCGSRG